MTREAACPLRKSGELVRLICSLTGAHPRSLSECSNSVLEEGGGKLRRPDDSTPNSRKNFLNHRQQMETHRQHACSDSSGAGNAMERSGTGETRPGQLVRSRLGL